MTPLQFDGKADAYLEWAVRTGFANFHQAAHETGLLWQRSGVISTTTLPTDPQAMTAAILRPEVQRVELATPVQGNDAGTNLPGLGIGSFEGELILGAIDDGCPFARQGLRGGDGASRVLSLWDQNPIQSVATGTRYGRIWTSTDLNGGTTEEDMASYERLGMKNLRRRATHGAHVMDLMAGPMPSSSRVSPSRMTLEGGDGSAQWPPGWERPHDDASKAPIFFVQLPEEAVEDPTGRWLGRHVLDGMDFIIDNALALWNGFAGPKRLVVNLSWGPQTGPHDGSSLLERAFDDRFAKCNAEGIELHFTLPAGNSHEARAHAQFSLSVGCQGLIWQVVPDARTPQFLEVWWPQDTPLQEVDIEVHSPDGQHLRFHGASLPLGQRGAAVNPHHNAWGITVVPHGRRFMALLALAPSRRSGCADAPTHGRWRINVGKVSVDSDRLVHVYVARNSANMGARRRSPDGYLFDPRYEETRHGRWPRVEPPDSQVRREGTLNGVATGAKPTVAGGYVLSVKTSVNTSLNTDPAAPYSSSGPATHRERNPDWALPSDESPFLRGVLASGVREGSAVRLTGTSTAAPQLARKLANDGFVESPDSLNSQPGRPPTNPVIDPSRGRRVGNGRVVTDTAAQTSAAALRTI
jgi:hypothetical protein